MIPKDVADCVSVMDDLERVETAARILKQVDLSDEATVDWFLDHLNADDQWSLFQELRSRVRNGLL